MDAQQQHDEEMSQRKGKLSPGSKARLQALLAKNSASSPASGPYYGNDPIEMAIADNPGLTRDEAEKMAVALGF